MAELKYIISADDSQFKKTMANVAKLAAENGGKMISDVNKAVDAEISKRKKVTKVIEEQTAAIQKRNAEENKASVRRASVDFQIQGQKDISSSVAGSNTSDVLVNENDLKKAAAANEAYSRTIVRVNKGLSDQAVQTKKVIATNSDNSGMLEKLKSQLMDFKVQADRAVSTEKLKEYNKNIQSIETQIGQLKNVGKVGFDELGNKMVFGLEKPIGAVNRLKAAMQAYGEMAASSTNPAIIEKYNRKLQESQLQLTRLKNVGKQGFDELGDKIDQTKKPLTGFSRGLSAGIEMLRRMAYMIPGLGLTGLLALAIKPVMDYIKSLQIVKKTLGEVFASSPYKEAIKDVTSMKNTMKLVDQGIISQDAALKQFNKTIGKTTGELKTFNQLSQFMANDADNYVKAVKLRADAQALLTLSVDKTAEAYRKLFEGPSTEDYAMAGLNVLMQNGATNFETELQKRVNASAIKSLQAGKDIEDMWKAAIERSEKFNRDNKINLDGEDKLTGEKAAENLLQRIADLRAEYTRKVMSEDDAEIQSVRDKFKKVTDLVTRFNANPKNKVKVKLGELDELRDNAITDLRFKHDTEKFKIELEKQKNLFLDHERFKLEASKEMADKRYGAEMVEFDSFEKYLESHQKALYDTASKRKLTRGEVDRLKMINAELTKERQRMQGVEANDFLKALALADNYEKKTLDLKKKYAKARADLGEGITKAESEALDRGFKEDSKALNKALIENLDSYKYFFENVADLSGKKLGAALNALELDLDDLAAKNPEVKKLVDLLRKELANIKLSKTVADFDSMANSLSFMADATREFGGGLSDALGVAGDLAGQIGNIKSDIASFKDAKVNGNIFGQISSGFGFIGAGFNIMSTLNNFLDRETAGDRRRAQNAELQLRATEGLTKALERQIKVAQEAYGTQKIEEYTKAIKESQKVIDEGAKTLGSRYAFTGDADLDKVIAKINKGEKLKGWTLWGESEKDLGKIVERSKDTLTTDIKELQSLLDNGRLDDQTAKIAQNFINAHDAIKQAENAIKELQTGTNFESLADDFVSAVSSDDPFKKLGENFEDTMKKAILNSFKGNAFKEGIQKFYDDLDEASKDGLTSSEIEKLRADYMKLGEAERARFDAISKVTGIDFSEKSKNTLSKNIEGIKETTANRLEGEFGGLRIAQLQLLEITKWGVNSHLALVNESLQVAIRNERNTYRTAENTEHLSRLENIETAIVALNSKTTSADALRRGGGY